MIKLTSFYPFPSWLQLIHEFQDEKIIIKKRSLSENFELDIEYSQIAEISYISSARADFTYTGFTLIALISIFSIYFHKSLYENLVFLTGVRFLFPIAVFSYLIGFFIKRLYCQLLDRHGNVITSIRVDRANLEDIFAAVELIKQKAKKTVGELDISEPFPEAKPRHELIEYDIPDFINKSTIRLYDTELIDYEKSVVEETITAVKYSDVHQFLYGKFGNAQWVTISLHLLLITLGISASHIVYDLPYILDHTIRQSAMPLMLIFSALMLLMYFKSDAIYLINDEDYTLTHIKFNKKNKKDVRQILEFINSKSPAREKGSFDSIKRHLD